MSFFVYTATRCNTCCNILRHTLQHAATLIYKEVTDRSFCAGVIFLVRTTTRCLTLLHIATLTHCNTRQPAATRSSVAVCCSFSGKKQYIYRTNLSLRKRAQCLRKRAQCLRKRAQCLRKRAQCLRKRAIHLQTSSAAIFQRSRVHIC